MRLNLMLRKKKVRIAGDAIIGDNSFFEGYSKVHSKVVFKGSLGIGSYIGEQSVLSADIGRFSSIGPRVSCNSGVHPYKMPFVSTSPVFYSCGNSQFQSGTTFAKRQMFDEFRFFDRERRISVCIGNDCWIGEGVFIVGGVKISNGAVVLAHAVVTKDVPPYAIVGGVPAKILGYRYEDDTIAYLERIQWWNQSIQWLSENYQLMSDIEQLKRVVL